MNSKGTSRRDASAATNTGQTAQVDGHHVNGLGELEDDQNEPDDELAPLSPSSSRQQKQQHHPSPRGSPVPLHNVVMSHGIAVEWDAVGAIEKLEKGEKKFDRALAPMELDGKVEEATVKRPTQQPPNMWEWRHIALYAHYAAVGLMGGSSGVARPFCTYHFHGPANTCANANSIIFLAWAFKILFALGTDSFKPFGMRRKPYMVAGWVIILGLLLLIAATVENSSVQGWMVMSMFVQFFLMIADVPADGYSVELGQLEPPERRGQILATGQLFRFMTCVLAGAIQSFLLNGPATNKAGCKVAWDSCWSWGLTISQYYYLMFALTAVLVFPIFFMEEIPDTSPHRTVKQFALDILDTCKNLTTTFLLIFIVGNNAFAISPFNVTTNLQYQVIGIPNLLAGIDSMTTYLTLSGGIYIFKRFLINKNWRTVNYMSGVVSSVLGLLWLLPFHNIGGTRNGWFTIFIDLDQSLTAGLSQVLFSMTVIELAKPGQEATVYELLISVANSCMLVSTTIATQFLTPLGATTCEGAKSSESCVDTSRFDATKGPARYSRYLLVVTSIGIASCLIFTSFLPTQKHMCEDWKRRGEKAPGSGLRGILTLVAAVVIVAYGIMGSVMLLDPHTACLPMIGGPGC